MKIVNNKKYIIEIHSYDYKKIRDAVTNHSNLATKIIDDGILAWDRICTCMDRLDDTVDYLNGYTLVYDAYRRSAFDFYNLLNCMYIIIDCIIDLAQIYKLDLNILEVFKKENNVFGEIYGMYGDDFDFFQYIRSLCAVHPSKTDRHKHYLNGAKIHCCPYVIWKNEYDKIRGEENGELTVRIYNSKGGSANWGNQLDLRIELFEKYLNKWLNFSNIVINAINDFYNSEYDKYTKIKLKEESEFEDYIKYLKYLSDENEKRYNYNQEYIFNYYIQVFSIKMSNKENNINFEKYKEAIKLGIIYKRNSIQSMKTEGFEYTGINNTETFPDNSLFYELESLNTIGTEFGKYSYNISKMYYLTDYEITYSNNDKYFARTELESIKELINKYVKFTNLESDIETVILVNMALYFANLKVDSQLNNSIPNDIRYRIDLV